MKRRGFIGNILGVIALSSIPTFQKQNLFEGWTFELDPDIVSLCGIDVESSLAQMMCMEIQKEIDKEILNKLLNFECDMG